MIDLRTRIKNARKENPRKQEIQKLFQEPRLSNKRIHKTLYYMITQKKKDKR